MVKAGSFLMRSPLTVVMVCPGGFGSEPGPGCDPGVVADGVTVVGGTTTGSGPGTRRCGDWAGAGRSGDPFRRRGLYDHLRYRN